MRKTFFFLLMSLAILSAPAMLSSTALADTQNYYVYRVIPMPNGYIITQYVVFPFYSQYGNATTSIPFFFQISTSTMNVASSTFASSTIASTSPMLPPIPAPLPLPLPITPVPQPNVVTVAVTPPAPAATPVRLRIPSAGINVPIQGVGTNSKGEMAVPSAASGAVGWYKDGPIPGESGSAVLDAHVFAAFAKLKDVKSGADIYVTMSDGSERHFRASEAKLFALSSLSPSQLFVQTNDADLNLITCAGSLTPDHSTYDHRLIVYSTLVRE